MSQPLMTVLPVYRCAGRWDCESEYKLCVSLLDKDRKVITEWTEEQRLGANHSLKDWLQVGRGDCLCGAEMGMN